MPMCHQHKYRSTVTAQYEYAEKGLAQDVTYKTVTRSDLCLKCLEDLLNKGQIRNVQLAASSPPGIP